MKKLLVTICVVFLVCLSQMMIYANAQSYDTNYLTVDSDTIDDSDIDTTTSEDDVPERYPIINNENTDVPETQNVEEEDNNFLVIGIIVGGIILVAGGIAAVVIVKRKKS